MDWERMDPSVVREFPLWVGSSGSLEMGRLDSLEDTYISGDVGSRGNVR